MKITHALAAAVRSVRADHAMLRHYDRRYASGAPRGGSLARDLVERAGFQMMVGYRAMRFFAEARVPLAPQLVARAVRFLYGADIHWRAEIADGVVIVHGMGLAISPGAKVGEGCVLSQNVTLGEGRDATTHATGGPILGARVHVGPGAAILGPIAIGADTKIMASCVLRQSVEAGSIVESPAPTIRARSRAQAARSTNDGSPS